MANRPANAKVTPRKPAPNADKPSVNALPLPAPNVGTPSANAHHPLSRHLLHHLESIGM